MDQNTTVFINILARLIEKYGDEVLKKIEEDDLSSSIFLLYSALMRVIIKTKGGNYYEESICLYSC